MEIKTQKLILRDLVDEDIDLLPSLINDLEVSKLLALVPYPYGKKDAEWFVNHCKEEARKNPRTSYELGIVLKDTSELVGCVGITSVNQWDGKATLGYWLGRKYFS
ncbi:MAG: GNAT family N-acetyltransferase [Nanoarchaeota archaeon]|nr:GNAT family N-acetyltransferase [Nanoarchaeota archaeon]